MFNSLGIRYPIIKCSFHITHMHTKEAQSVPFVGKRLAEKIFEIVSSGKLRRLENVDKERERVIEMFKNIHGVGQVIAQQFYAQVCG